MNPALRPVAALALTFFGSMAIAQTCASPIPLVVTATPYWNSNNSCNFGNQIDTQFGGSVYTPGREAVYLVRSPFLRAPGPPATHFVLSPAQNYDTAIFACPQCGGPALCIDAQDSFGAGVTEFLNMPAQIRPYYLIVDSTSIGLDNCGNYTLQAFRQ